MRTTGRGFTALLAALVVGVGLQARAEQKVEVQSEVVLASNQGQVIDPPQLAKMKEEFAKSGISYSSWKRLSQARAVLEKGKAQEISFPDGRKATLQLQELKEGSAFVRVTLAQDGQRKLVDTVYQLGRHGSVFIRSGDFQGGVLILVLSPPDQKR
jgi:hypothetical protein